MPAGLPFFNFWVEGSGAGLTVSDNSGNLGYKGLISDRFDLELCGYVRKTDQEVPHGSTASSIVFGVVDAQVLNERNVHKSRLITDQTTSQVVVLDKFLGTAWDQLQRFAPSWTVTKDMVGVSSVPTSNFLVVYGKNEEHNPSNFKRLVITVPSWQTITTTEDDPETGLRFTVTETVVAHGTAVPASTTTVFYSQRQVDAERDILTTVTAPSAWDQTTYRTVQYTFPALLAQYTPPSTYNVSLGLIFSNYFEESSLRSVFGIQVNLRESFTAPIKAKVQEQIVSAATAASLLANTQSDSVAYGTTLDLGSATHSARLFVPRPRDISYSGVMFSLQVENVLNDGDTIVATASSEDEYYGSSAVDSFTYPSSTITATEYIALIGSTVCVEDSCEQWKYGLFKRTRMYVVLQ